MVKVKYEGHNLWKNGCWGGISVSQKMDVVEALVSHKHSLLELLEIMENAAEEQLPLQCSQRTRTCIIIVAKFKSLPDHKF